MAEVRLPAYHHTPRALKQTRYVAASLALLEVEATHEGLLACCHVRCFGSIHVHKVCDDVGEATSCGHQTAVDPAHGCGKPDLHVTIRQAMENTSQAPGGCMYIYMDDTTGCSERLRRSPSQIPHPRSSMLEKILDSGLRSFVRSNLPLRCLSCGA